MTQHPGFSGCFFVSPIKINSLVSVNEPGERLFPKINLNFGSRVETFLQRGPAVERRN
jgi:hypothetical protein